MALACVCLTTIFLQSDFKETCLVGGSNPPCLWAIHIISCESHPSVICISAQVKHLNPSHGRLPDQSINQSINQSITLFTNRPTFCLYMDELSMYLFTSVSLSLMYIKDNITYIDEQTVPIIGYTKRVDESVSERG